MRGEAYQKHHDSQEKPEGIVDSPMKQEHEGSKGEKNRALLLKSKLDDMPDAQLLFVGSLSCTRHKPYLNIGRLMREKRAAILCPTMTDFSTGRYLRQVADAIIELSDERNSKNFVLAHGCQWVILSSDAELLKEQLMEGHHIHLTVWDDSHLANGDHD